MLLGHTLSFTFQVPMKTPQEFHEALYDLLVAEGGASKNPFRKSQFVGYLQESKGFPKEYRFCGHLLGGGKLWHDPYTDRCPYWVSCYSEDRPKVQHLVVALNERVYALYTKYKQENP